ncbi:hypothetical protein FR483_n550L [Paramecium bursaria Chlorella virus FR483]|uniref:Uncharacterized protein n550L n=1 Tax=Paramecium bursaria Chlorella virus FR483 TaxID=399781 RepID=A7J7Q4_PBCVF|nr:hypothetical protein FR483_n550L [Paramecium bursaria Chlorella virus FR483]ABT15835.1 hypothetical protein FR483_n550L [Paramecium bursaria Chlorella virus FR483]
MRTVVDLNAKDLAEDVGELGTIAIATSSGALLCIIKVLARQKMPKDHLGNIYTLIILLERNGTPVVVNRNTVL